MSGDSNNNKQPNVADALLAAARDDRAPAGPQDRLLVTLGLSAAGAGAGAGAVAAASASTTQAAAATSALTMKSVVIVSTVLALGGGALIGSFLSSSPKSADEPQQRTPTPAAMSAATEQAPPPSPPPAVATRVEDLPAAAVPTAKTAPPPTASASSAEPDLAREVALIDEARKALARKDPAAALRALDTHDREMPAGALMPESNVLRIEAALATGDRARAKELADAFLATNPSGPQARRVRALLE